MIDFQPVCTLPESKGNFVQTPNVRSTMEIVWACLSVTILCTWSVVHLDIPVHLEPTTKLQKVRWRCHRTWRKIKYFVLVLIAPEMQISGLLAYWAMIREAEPELVAMAKKWAVPWSRTHGFFLAMGGMAIRFDENYCSIINNNNNNTDDNSTRWAISQMQHMEEETMKLEKYGRVNWRPHNRSRAAILALNKPLKVDIIRLQGNIWFLDNIQFAAAAKAGLFGGDSGTCMIPSIATAEILDRDKSDGLVWILALVQITWLVIQVITRWIQGLPTSQLEISTIALAATSIFIYILFWNVPRDIMFPMYIDVPSHKITPDLIEKIHDATVCTNGQFRDLYQLKYRTIDSTYHLRGLGMTTPQVVGISLAGSGFLLGAVHLAAWNFDFPTEMERTLWRTNSLVVMIAPLFFSVIYLVLNSHLVLNSQPRLQRRVFVTVSTVYFLSRVLLLVESVRSLYFLPPGAFMATWTGNALHVG